MGLTFGLFWVWALARTVLLGATDAPDFFTAGAGVFSGVIEGVTFFGARRTAYGSAVAGRVNSGRGRMGLLTVPPIKEPVPLELEPNAGFVELPSAEGGRAAVDDAVEAVDAVLDPRDFADCDFAGV